MAHVVLTACGVTTTHDSTGTMDIIDTAPTGYGALQTIADALANGDIASGDTVDYDLLDANGVDWESGRGTVTNAATDTLARTTIYRSTNSDAAIDLSAGTHTILFSPSAKALTAPRGHIEFDSPQYMTYSSGATTTVTVAAGRGWIDDEYLEWTTGEASGTVSLVERPGTQALMWVYLYNNAGTVDQDTSTTEPAWNPDRGFWVKTGDPTRRLIGWILVWEPPTSTTERIVPYTATISGRHIRIIYSGDTDGVDVWNAASFRCVQDTNNTADDLDNTWALQGLSGGMFDGVDIVPTSQITEFFLSTKVTSDNTSSVWQVGVSTHAVQATQPAYDYPYTVRNDPGDGTGTTYFGRTWVPYGGAPRWGLTISSGQADVLLECQGAGMMI